VPRRRRHPLTRIVRRRYVIGAFALAGLLVTFALMLAFGWSDALGAVGFAPWVALLGADGGMLAGTAAGGAGGALWIAASFVDSIHPSTSQIVIRVVVLALLGTLSGVVGDMLRATETARAGTVALQRALIDATIDGICLTDEQGNILIGNERLQRIAHELGMPDEGTVPERLLRISEQLADPDLYRRRMREIAHSPTAVTVDEFELTGTGRVFRGYTSPVRDRRGHFIGRLWTLRDVTADKELERMRDAFVATVSHELRTPLTSISGFLEMLEDEQHLLGESGQMYLDVIRRSAERLHQLVEDLLLVAQIEAQRVEIRKEPVDLGDIAQHSVESVRAWASEKGVRVELLADHPPLTSGDARRLAQIVDNLLSNAVKFSPAGGDVSVEVGGDGETVRLVVSDTGIGIPDDEQGHVFSRFYRASTANELAVPGTGLGLAITRALVDQHGGTISLESRQGEGTKVTVTLPAA
jgi:signal transduction histidine kinase